MRHADVIVCGGGIIGSALAYGLVKQGLKTLVLDGPDTASRASRGNFGLVWVHGKGLGMRPYARWSLTSADLYAEFTGELRERSGVDCSYRRTGGVWLTLGEAEFAGHCKLIARLHEEAGAEGYRAEIMDRAAIERVMPGIGPTVAGGSWSEDDGEVNPLALLRALHAALAATGATRQIDSTLTAIAPTPGGGFVLTVNGERIGCTRLVIAAGLGCKPIAAMLGMDVPVGPDRGQILVTERIAPRFHVTSNMVRQTPEGSILLGATSEDVGEDDRVTRAGLRNVARMGATAFPFLAGLRVVRSWGALRAMTPDGYPIYEQVPGHPGAFVVTSHSGITLAAAHALRLAPQIAEGHLDADFAPFSATRFHHAQAIH
jgi:glycine/D-amino acid oxidase-like deaminating enzyme